MKFKLLLLSVIGAVSIANAQFTVKDDQGVVLNDGDVVEFGSLDYADAEYAFFVTSENPSETIYSRVEYISQSNATNPDFEQLCYGFTCYYGIELGTTVPPADAPAVDIPVGHTTSMGNHFYSSDPGNGTDNVDFVFAFKQYEAIDSDVEIGTPLIFTYRYNPTLSVNNVTKVNLSLISTMVTDELVMDVNEPVQVKLYDMQGRLVKEASYVSGRQIMNVSSLSSAQYIVQFKNEGGAKKTSKVIIR